MAVILLARHSATEQPGTSLARLFGGLERLLGGDHRVIPVPPVGEWSAAVLRTWLRGAARDADLLLAANYPLLRMLRELGWTGRVIFKALGELPRGAPGLRSVLPYLRADDTVWCSSHADARIYRTLVEAGGPRLAVVPYGVDGPAYRPLGRAARAALRRRWGLAERDFVMVYAGRVTVEKNVHGLLEAAGRLCGGGRPVRLLVAGNWHDAPFEQFCVWPRDLRGRLSRLVRDAGLERSVHLLPPLADARLNDLYNLGDVLINLTLHHDENFGYAQVEAMSAGLPVVATAWGGLRDTVRDGETGFLVDTWLSTHGIRLDLPGFVDRVERMMECSRTTAAMGRAAAAHARREFSPAAYRRRLLALVEGALSAPPDGAAARYTAFGAAYHARFRTMGGRHDEWAGVAPVYRDLADRDYTTLIEPYTSRGWPAWSPGSRAFAALDGRVRGGWFVSSDVLWPGRVPIDEREARVLARLDRWSATPAGDLDCPDEVLAGLLRKGLVGMTDGRLD